MKPQNWEANLRPLLKKAIGRAIDDAQVIDYQNIIFPWIGDNCVSIMTDAAICVLRGMEDMENYVEGNNELKEIPA